MILIQIICVMMGLWIYQLDKHESSTIILMIFLIGIILLSIWTRSYIIGFLAAIINVFVFNYFLRNLDIHLKYTALTILLHLSSAF